MSEKFMTPMFRVSYPYVLDQNKNGKYSISMVFDKDELKTDPAARKAFESLKTAIKQAGAAAFPGQTPDDKGRNPRLMPIKDGDTAKPGDSVYANSLFCEATTQYEPEVFDRNRQDIISKKEFYPGCYARARVHVYTWTDNGGGVSVGFDAVQKLKDGEAIGEGGSAKDFFEDGLDTGPDEVSEVDDLLS